MRRGPSRESFLKKKMKRFHKKQKLQNNQKSHRGYGDLFAVERFNYKAKFALANLMRSTQS